MNSSMDSDKMAAAQRPGEVAMPQHRVRHASRRKKREVFHDNPLGLARLPRPDGAGRAEQEHAIGDAPPPDAELSLPVQDELAARQWLVRQIARRAVEIMAEGNDEEQEGHLREV